MKVYILFLIAFLPFEINAQTTIGVYTNNEFSLELSDPEASIVFDSIKVEFSYGGNFDSYSISDPNPYNSSSVGYLIFKGDSSGRIRTWGFLLTKSISSDVTYMIDDSDISVEGGWTCNNKGCSACLPERERILGLPIGNVVSCDCEAPTYGQEPHCELSTSGDNLGETIRKIISIIIPFL